MEYKYKLGDVVVAFGKQFKLEDFSEMGYPIGEPSYYALQLRKDGRQDLRSNYRHINEKRITAKL